jgi:hypothetical protein
MILVGLSYYGSRIGFSCGCHGVTALQVLIHFFRVIRNVVPSPTTEDFTKILPLW